MTTSDRGSAGPEGVRELAEALAAALHLATPPIGIAFAAAPPEGVARYDAPMSEPQADGRRGRVPAGCVFWVRAADRTFTTVPEDHGNCSVGSVTHGLASKADVAANEDVSALVSSGWVDEATFASLPTISEAAGSVTYGPLTGGSFPVEPDVVLLRVNPRQMMVLSDAVPGLRIEGKPQCHIVAIAKEHGEVAASVGCALSRARTGMRAEEMTCALPGRRLGDVVEAVVRAVSVDTEVARYAAADARRFEG